MIDKLRKRIIEVAYRDGMGHIPSALSILDIIWILYNSVMTKDDRFILSKGHGCMALYAVLEEKGLLDWSKPLWGHPKRGGAILASTGSLGHGLPMAVGLAMAKKIRNEPGRVFVLVGDGECNEGTTWESAMLAAHHRLDNLVVIVDQNHSSDRALNTGKLDDKFRAFNWNSYRVDGHNDEGLKMWIDVKDKIIDDCEVGSDHLVINPTAIIALTVKGHGIPFMENDNSWHNRRLTKEDYDGIMAGFS